MGRFRSGGGGSEVLSASKMPQPVMSARMLNPRMEERFVIGAPLSVRPRPRLRGKSDQDVGHRGTCPSSAETWPRLAGHGKSASHIGVPPSGNIMANAVSSAPPSSTSLREASALPRTFGSYTLFELVGKGGMAQIYLARAETELGATRLAVVKQILPAFADDPRFAEMLIHEAKLAARLNHRHIVQVFDLGRARESIPRGSGEEPEEASKEERLFIAMEYVEGFDLNVLLRQCTEKKIALPLEHAIGIVADMLEGLDYAHRCKGEDDAALGIVHRDVSPSNVLISFDGEVKLCDFGIAHANDVVRVDANEALKGKAGYMSPEHARGEALDARADVFAAGIILWELIAGRRLYKSKIDLSLLEQARRAEIPPLPEKDLPEMGELQRIVSRALATDRNERYPSAGAFQRDLEEYLVKTALVANRLKLGEWMKESFGTAMIEQRRASERRLPKSVPPPRSSERMRAGNAPTSSAIVPTAPRVPSDLTASPEPEEEPKNKLVELPISAGAMRAFKETLEHPNRVTLEPGSLAGAALDKDPSSARLIEPVSEKDMSDAELLAWARRRGWWVFWTLALTIVALLIALGIHLMR